MTLSPFEVERQEFGRAPMGYRRNEVDEFLDEVRGTLVTLWEERADLREENERLGERVARFTALEDQLKNTLLLAQDSAEKATEQARREAELVMREASQKAREVVHAAHEEGRRLEQAVRDLQVAEADTRQRFRALAQTVLTQLDEDDANGEHLTTLRAMVSNGSHTGSQPRVASAPATAAAPVATPTGAATPSAPAQSAMTPPAMPARRAAAAPLTNVAARADHGEPLVKTGMAAHEPVGAGFDARD